MAECCRFGFDRDQLDEGRGVQVCDGRATRHADAGREALGRVQPRVPPSPARPGRDRADPPRVDRSVRCARSTRPPRNGLRMTVRRPCPEYAARVRSADALAGMSNDTPPSPLRQQLSAETTEALRILTPGAVGLVPSSSIREPACPPANHLAAALVRLQQSSDDGRGGCSVAEGAVCRGALRTLATRPFGQ